MPIVVSTDNSEEMIKEYHGKILVLTNAFYNLTYASEMPRNVNLPTPSHEPTNPNPNPNPNPNWLFIKPAGLL